MPKNFYENHIHKFACDEDNYKCSQFIGRAYIQTFIMTHNLWAISHDSYYTGICKPLELNRGNCIHRVDYSYHPLEIGHCSPAKECYMGDQPYSFGEIDSEKFKLEKTTSHGQGCYCVIHYMRLNRTKSSAVIDQARFSLLKSYS